MQVYQQFRRKTVGIEDVTVVDVEIADTAAYLVLGDFLSELLLFREGELLEDDDVAVGLGEVVGMIDHMDGREFNGLSENTISCVNTLFQWLKLFNIH